jgi:hypothetical protein
MKAMLSSSSVQLVLSVSITYIIFISGLLFKVSPGIFPLPRDSFLIINSYLRYVNFMMFIQRN